ncbi:MAG: HVO_0416 family zinc finger protein [Salinirussus sp.]
MASAPRDDDLFDDFLALRGHDMEEADWDHSYNKLQCPECGGLHPSGADGCSVCGWSPA